MNDLEYEEIIDKARHASLEEYFRTAGYTLKKISGQLYVNEVKGLVIKPETNSWFSHYNQVGRANNSIDCLTMILDKSFKEAVFELTGQDIAKKHSVRQKPKENIPKTHEVIQKTEEAKDKKEFKLPEHAPTQRRVFAYFHSTRFIPNDVIREMVDEKLLYQAEFEIKGQLQGKDQIFKKANAVFVHINDEGNAVGGEIQGLDINKRFKGTVAGTGESFFKFVPMKDSKPIRAFVFESAIDLMSFYSMCSDKSKLKGTMLVSMAGLKNFVVDRLKGQGLHVISAVDNDNAGRKFERINGLTRSDFVTEKLDIHDFKDWNERLEYQTKHPEFLEDEKMIIQERREKLTEEHKQEAMRSRK